MTLIVITLTAVEMRVPDARIAECYLGQIYVHEQK
jgi:hypothetical protein